MISLAIPKFAQNSIGANLIRDFINLHRVLKVVDLIKILEETKAIHSHFKTEEMTFSHRFSERWVVRAALPVFNFHSQAANRPGEDHHYKMQVEFKDAVLGAQKEITLSNGKRLQVKIPGGIKSGTKLRFKGHGGPGHGKGAAGDAFVEIDVKPSDLFVRHENDLESELPITLQEAILGGEVQAPTIDGSVMLKIPK